MIQVLQIVLSAFAVCVAVVFACYGVSLLVRRYRYSARSFISRGD